MNYLTTQDVLWIHSQVNRWPQSFDVMALEEAIGYQYTYGRSGDLLPAAGRFLEGLLRRPPFQECNAETTLGSTLCLLRLNGYLLSPLPADTDQLLSAIAAERSSGLDLVRAIAGAKSELGDRQLEPADLKAVRSHIRIAV